jgi:hypothetical protein
VNRICVHKTYPTEEKAISKWYSLGKARRANLTTYQCTKCLGWRVTSYAVKDRLRSEAREKKPASAMKKDWKPRVSKAEAAYIAQRTGEPIQDVEDWLAKEATTKHNEMLEEARFRKNGQGTVKRGGHSALRITTLPKLKKAIWPLPLPNNFTLPEPNFKAAMRLARKVTRQFFPDWATPIKPKSTRQRIPIGKALEWRLSYGEVMKWDRGSLHYQAVRSLPLYEVPMTFLDCLMNYCVGRWGEDHGNEVCQTVALDVLERAERDLRRSKYRAQYDKRKPRRRNATGGKKNRHRKPTFFSQQKYWEWLLKRSTQVHNNWRANPINHPKESPSRDAY